MNKTFFISVLFLLIFCGGLFIGVFFPHKKSKIDIPSRINVEEKKETLYPVVRNHPIVVLITAYNVLPWCERNLRSVLEQNYLNYRVIYIDDCSNDGTHDRIEEFLEKNRCNADVKIIRNEKRKGSALNVYNAIHDFCQDDEIVVCLDGDDWFSHEDVLSKLNATYSNPNVWMTYSNYLDYPSYHMGDSGPFDQDEIARVGVRGHKWVSGQLKTFYAGLFKKVRLEDFLFEGDFVFIKWDWISLFAMFEMANEHYAYIPEVMLIHNTINPLMSEKVNLGLEIAIGNYARLLTPYAPLSNSFFKKEKKPPTVDIVIFSLDRCMQLCACLESISKYVSGLNQTYVIYVSTTPSFDEAYEKLKKLYPRVIFIRESTAHKDDFKLALLNTTFDVSKGKYVLFGVDSSLFIDQVDLNYAASMLKKTKGYAFLLCLGGNQALKKNFKLLTFPDGISAWQINSAEGTWGIFHNLEMTMYRKKDIEGTLRELDYSNPNSLRREWGLKQTPRSREMALCFSEPKSIHLSGYQKQSFVSLQDYNEKFKEGFKIDISPFDQVKSESHHIDAEVSFIPLTP